MNTPIFQALLMVIETFTCLSLFRLSLAPIATIGTAEEDELSVIRKYGTYATVVFSIYNSGLHSGFAGAAQSFLGVAQIVAILLVIFASQRIPALIDQLIKGADTLSEQITEKIKSVDIRSEARQFRTRASAALNRFTRTGIASQASPEPSRSAEITLVQAATEEGSQPKTELEWEGRVWKIEPHEAADLSYRSDRGDVLFVFDRQLELNGRKWTLPKAVDLGAADLLAEIARSAPRLAPQVQKILKT